MQRHIQMEVGDGRQISLFYDDWLCMGAIGDICGNTSSWGSNLTVSNWINPAGGWSIPGSFCRRYPDIAAKINGIPITGYPDSITWKLTSTGEYTIASMYQVCRRKGSRVTWDNIVWSPNIPPKYSFCNWLLWKHALKTRKLLASRGITLDKVCHFCSGQDETFEHLFFQCQFTRDTWQQVLLKMNINRTPLSWEREHRWIQRKCSGRSRKAKNIKLAVSCTIYYIWQERNLRIFQQKSRQANGLANIIHSFVMLQL